MSRQERKQGMDLGLWATWYDVDPADEADFLDWTHGVYLPWLLQQPGMAWAAHYRNDGGGPTMERLRSDPHRRGGDDVVPNGVGYLLLVGAASSYTFYSPHVLDLPMPDGFKERLEARKRGRTEFYAEEFRVDGNATDYRFVGSTSAPVVQFGLYNLRTVDGEMNLAKWYAQQRLPLMSRMGACVRTRKLISGVGWAKHAILYEFSSLEARLREHEEPHESQTLKPSAWTGQIADSVAYPPGSPFVGERIWPPIPA
jgi:hypothetical protein